MLHEFEVWSDKMARMTAGNGLGTVIIFIKFLAFQFEKKTSYPQSRHVMILEHLEAIVIVKDVLLPLLMTKCKEGLL